MGVAFTTYGMGSGVYMEEYANLDTNPLFEGLPEKPSMGLHLSMAEQRELVKLLETALFKDVSILALEAGSPAQDSWRPNSERTARILNGIMMGSGLGAAEEYAAEGATAYLQLLADEFGSKIKRSCP